MIIKEVLDKIPERQDSIQDQLLYLIRVANRLGMYDAADYLKSITSTENVVDSDWKL